MDQRNYLTEAVALAKQGDRQAMGKIYEATYNEVWRTVCALIRDEQEAMDVLQDTYLKAFRSLDQLENEASLRPWLRQIAANTAKNQLCKKKPALFTELSETEELPLEMEEERTEALPEARLDQKEVQRLVREMLDTLTDAQRVVIGLYYYRDASVKDIAKELGISENTVKGHLRYGRQKIEKKVRELKKQGVELYGLSPMLFFRALFKEGSMPPPKAAASLGGRIAKNGLLALQGGGKALLARRIAVAGLSLLAAGGVALGGLALARQGQHRGDVRPTDPSAPEQLVITEPTQEPTELPLWEREAFVFPEIQMTAGSDAPEAVQDFARGWVRAKIDCLAEDPAQGIQEAEIVGLTRLNTGTVGLDEGVDVYLLEYRLTPEGEGSTVLTEAEAAGQPCLFLRWENDGAGVKTWKRLCLSYTDWIEETYGTETYLEKFGNAYTAAAMTFRDRYGDGTPASPQQITEREYYAQAEPELSLQLAGNGSYGPLTGNAYSLGRVKVLAEVCNWTPVEGPFPEEAASRMEVRYPDTGAELRWLFAAGGGLVRVREGETETLWFPERTESKDTWVGRPKQECQGTLARQIRHDVFDNLELEYRLRISYNGTAEEAAAGFVELEFPFAVESLSPGNSYRFTEYELLDWEVLEVNEQGTLVVGSFSFRFLPDDFSSDAIWAGGGIGAVETEPGVWKIQTGRYFSLERQGDYWNAGLATGYGGETTPTEPPAPTEDGDPDPALAEALNDLFSQDPWYAQALSSRYAAPERVDLRELFYNGVSDEAWNVSEEEAALVRAQDPGLYNDHVGTVKVSREDMDRVLQQYFGLTLDQTVRRGLTFAYVAETDSYYHCHGDTNAVNVRVQEARTRADGTILFTYENPREILLREDCPLWTAGLQPTEAGYRLLFNLPGAWTTPEDAGDAAFLYGGDTGWRSEQTDPDGTDAVRELSLREDGSLYYREGDPESEFSWFAWGRWWLEGDRLRVLLTESDEGFWNAQGGWLRGTYVCAPAEEGMTLTQDSETGFGAAQEGWVLTFASQPELTGQLRQE